LIQSDRPMAPPLTLPLTHTIPLGLTQPHVPRGRGSAIARDMGRRQQLLLRAKGGSSCCSIQRQGMPRNEDAEREELARARVDKVVTKSSLVVVLVETANPLLVDCHEL